MSLTVSAPAAETDYWGTLASSIQTGISISNGAITGTLHKLTSGALVTTWGAGYFIALKFAKDSDATSIKVGMSPSAGSGMMELDSDYEAVLKVTDKDRQRVKVVQSRTGETKDWIFDLSGLTLD